MMVSDKGFSKVSMRMFKAEKENAKLQADLKEALDVLAELLEFDTTKDLPDCAYAFLSTVGLKAMAVLNKHQEAKDD